MILGKNLKFLSCLLSFEKGLDMYFYNFFIKKKAFLTIKMPFSDSRKICIFSYFSFFQRFAHDFGQKFEISCEFAFLLKMP